MADFGPPSDSLGACYGSVGSPPRDTLVTAADGIFQAAFNAARFATDGCLWARAIPPAGSGLEPALVSGLPFHSRHEPPIDTVRLRMALPARQP